MRGNWIGVLLYIGLSVAWLPWLLAYLRGVPMDAGGVFAVIMMPIVFFASAAIGAYTILRHP